VRGWEVVRVRKKKLIADSSSNENGGQKSEEGNQRAEDRIRKWEFGMRKSEKKALSN